MPMQNPKKPQAGAVEPRRAGKAGAASDAANERMTGGKKAVAPVDPPESGFEQPHGSPDGRPSADTFTGERLGRLRD